MLHYQWGTSAWIQELTQKSLLYTCDIVRQTHSVSVCVFSWGELVIFSAQPQQFCNTWLYVPRARAHCSFSMITAHCHALGWFYICERPYLRQVWTHPFSLDTASGKVLPLPLHKLASMTLSFQTLGRWKSSAFLAYIRTPVDDLLSVAEILVR